MAMDMGMVMGKRLGLGMDRINGNQAQLLMDIYDINTLY